MLKNNDNDLLSKCRVPYYNAEYFHLWGRISDTAVLLFRRQPDERMELGPGFSAQGDGS
jgi:hypothetical protein